MKFDLLKFMRIGSGCLLGHLVGASLVGFSVMGVALFAAILFAVAAFCTERA